MRVEKELHKNCFPAVAFLFPKRVSIELINHENTLKIIFHIFTLNKFISASNRLMLIRNWSLQLIPIFRLKYLSILIYLPSLIFQSITNNICVHHLASTLWSNYLKTFIACNNYWWLSERWSELLTHMLLASSLIFLTLEKCDTTDEFCIYW